MPFLIAAAASIALTAPGPKGPLSGTFVNAGEGSPVVVIIPGSGPTDRDGNSPLGITAASYRLLAEALAGKGVSTLRIDKRGMFGSKAAVADANAVTLADYAADMGAWARVVRKHAGVGCVWLMGHSEGGLVALVAAQAAADICGLVLVAAPGRRLSDILREQLRANPANAPVLDDAMAAIEALEKGMLVDVSAMHPALQSLFAPQVQSFLIDMFAKDPAALASKVTKPMLIVSGGRDIQVSEVDARALAAAQAKATLKIIPTMNHVLKDVATEDRAANMETYADPSLPVNARLVETIAGFVRPQR
jgi:pimeloyl-ACP methyl ester carboxylesterase